MEFRHRELIKKYTPTLQQSINLFDIRDSLRKSKIFTACMIKDIYDGKASFFEELPTRGPDAFFRFINLLKTNGLTLIAEDLLHVSTPSYQISDHHGYNFILINCSSEGIVSSEELNDILEGCKAEAVELDKTLARIGYENHKYKTNLPLMEVDAFLKDFSKINFSEVNSCIIIILGLGAKNKDSKAICVKDGKYVSLHDIVNLFSDTNCPSLKYKPKIFLLSSFDFSHNDSMKNVKILPEVNDTFIYYFPSVNNYKLVKETKSKYFGEILTQKLLNNDQKFDFEAIFKSSYKKFNNQFLEKKFNIPECERLGNCREKIDLL